MRQGNMHLPCVIVITVAGAQIWLSCGSACFRAWGITACIAHPPKPRRIQERTPVRGGSNPFLALTYT